MKKIIITIIAFGAIITSAFSQNCDYHAYDNKNYIFTSYVSVTQCKDGLGNSLAPEVLQTVEKDFTFNVVHVMPDCNSLVIQLDNFKKGQTVLASTFNGKFFILKLIDFARYATEDKSEPRYSIQFGTFTTPFKFRPTKSIFTNNLSLGTSVNYLHKIKTNFAWGFNIGISLTSVTLDSLSTNYTVKTSTDRPALTPSVNFVFAYKNINFTVGTGADYVNKATSIENSWIFNGKPWLGFGIGINLFTSSAGTTTQKSDKQD